MTRSNLCRWFLAVLSPSARGRCHPKEFTFSETGSNLHFVRRKTESTVTGQEEDAVHEHTSRSLCAEWSAGTAEARTERLLRTLAPFESPELAISLKEQVSMFEVSPRLTASFFFYFLCRSLSSCQGKNNKKIFYRVSVFVLFFFKLAIPTIFLAAS